jgi:hypothetical protein
MGTLMGKMVLSFLGNFQMGTTFKGMDIFQSTKHSDFTKLYPAVSAGITAEIRWADNLFDGVEFLRFAKA